MAIRARFIGLDKHKRRMKVLSSFEIDGVVGAVLFEGADWIKADIQHNITAGSVSGKGHVASLPGEYPNSDTKVLMRNVEAKRTGRVEAEVSSNAPYAAALEFRTSKMEARPHVRPSRDRMLPKVRARMVEQLDKLVKRSG